MNFVGSLDVHVKLRYYRMQAPCSGRRVGQSMIFVVGRDLSFVTGTLVQAQHPEVESYWARIWVTLRPVGVHIAGFGQEMEERMVEGFVDLPDRIHGCSRDGSRSSVRRGETAAVVKASGP
jgi:hypothetical protein